MAASKPTGKRAPAPSQKSQAQQRGEGDELHLQAGGTHPAMTTAQGIPVADNQNSLREGRAAPPCWRTSSSARRSPTSTTSAFPNASCTRAAAPPMAISN